MDNRRRPDSRRESGSPYARPAYAPARPDPEPVAELIEIGPVPQPRHRGAMPAALGVTLFAFGVLAGSALVRLLPEDTPVPSGSSAAGASSAPVGAVATASASAGPRPTGSPRATPLVTPVPTRPPWAWAPGTFDTDEYGYPTGLWSVAGKIVVATEVESRTLDFRTSVDGVSWLTNRSSPAIRDYGASAVIDDRLWFALRIAGLQEDRLEIGYPVWAGEGANLQWKTKGAVAGVMPDWVAALGRIGDTWMMSAGTDGDQDGRLELWASDDAIHWSTIKVAGAESVGINHLQQFGSYLVGLGQLQAEGDAPISVRTKDGRHWTTMPFPGPSGSTAIYGMACGTSACVAVGSTSAIGVERPAVWSTTDGLEWRAVATDLTDARSEGFLSMIVATPAGFIAMGAPNQEALLSRDGTTWQSVRVLPESTSVQLFQLVVTGNVVFAFGEPSAFAGANQWIGDLGTLPFP